MARCLGSMTWPCDHAEKHSKAAILGWLRRRGMLGRSRSDKAAFHDLGIHRAHTDKSHKGLVRFQEKKGGKWFEIKRADFDEMVRATKEELRGKRSEAKQQAIDERMLRAERRSQHANVVKRLRRLGGIRPDLIPSGSNKTRPPNYEEWRDLPAQVRKYNKHNPRQGVALDDAAATIREEFGLNIHNGDDLAKYLQEEQLHRRKYRLRKSA